MGERFGAAFLLLRVPGRSLVRGRDRKTPLRTLGGFALCAVLSRTVVSDGRSANPEAGTIVRSVKRAFDKAERAVVLVGARRTGSRLLIAEFAQDAGEVGAVGWGEPIEGPLGLGAAGGADRVEDAGGVLGQFDQGGSAVAGIGAPDGQAAGFQGVDDLGGRAGRDLQVLG